MKYALDSFLKLLNSLICIYNDTFEILLKIGAPFYGMYTALGFFRTRQQRRSLAPVINDYR